MTLPPRPTCPHPDEGRRISDPGWNSWDEIDDGPDDRGDDYNPADECGRFDGGCMLAGTEHCDFECPFRDSVDLRQAEAAHIPVLRIDPAAPACLGVGG